MKIDFSQPICGLDGQPIYPATRGEDGAVAVSNDPMLLRSVCTGALLGVYEAERHLTGDDKVKRADMAKRIYSSGEPIDLKAEDIVELKKLVNMAYPSPLVVSAAYEMLDPCGAK